MDSTLAARGWCAIKSGIDGYAARLTAPGALKVLRLSAACASIEIITNDEIVADPLDEQKKVLNH